MLARLSWASVRTAVVLIGVPFVTITLAGACLDYAGEDLFAACDTEEAEDAGTPPGSGSGSGATVTPGSGSGSGEAATERPDCGAFTPPPGSGSGSGS